MAIIQEHFTINNIDFIRTYSDAEMMIHGGSPESDYLEACDLAELERTYTETDIPIDSESTTEEIIDILMGVEE